MEYFSNAIFYHKEDRIAIFCRVKDVFCFTGDWAESDIFQRKNGKLQQIFAEHLTVPKRSRKSYQNGPGRSKLAPYAEQIKAWQAKGMTLREIATELQKYGCVTTAQNLSLFLKKK